MITKPNNSFNTVAPEARSDQLRVIIEFPEELVTLYTYTITAALLKISNSYHMKIMVNLYLEEATEMANNVHLQVVVQVVDLEDQPLNWASLYL